MKSRFSNALILIAAALSLLVAAAPRVNTTTGNSNVGSPSVPDEWKELLDTTTAAFWLGSNPKMDKGFLQFAMDPNPDNAKRWLIRMSSMRNALHKMEKLTEQANKELIEAGTIADDYGFNELYKAAMGESRRPSEHSDRTFPQGLDVFFVFNPRCPACKRQAAILKGLPSVQPVQLGGDSLENIPGLEPSIWPNGTLNDYIQQHNPAHDVPMLLFYKPDSTEILPLIGYSDMERILRAAQRFKQ